MARLGHALDCVIVNASGGGLTAGIALAVKARAPAARIYTAEPAGFDDHARSFRSGKRERNPALTGTICDALMAQSPGKLTFEINRVLVGDGVTATEEEVARAVAFAFRELKLVVEPGGAVALAALLAGKLDVAGKTAVVVLSGGNVDPGAVRPPGGVTAARPMRAGRLQMCYAAFFGRTGPHGRCHVHKGSIGGGGNPRAGAPARGRLRADAAR